MQVLIVEDDILTANALKKELKQRGVSAEVVRTVADGMNRALRVDYDLVVLDLFVLDGATVSLSNFIRLRMPNTPILSITGSSVFADGDHNAAMSADYLIRKPLSPIDVADIAFHLMGVPIEQSKDAETDKISSGLI